MSLANIYTDTQRTPVAHTARPAVIMEQGKRPLTSFLSVCLLVLSWSATVYALGVTNLERLALEIVPQSPPPVWRGEHGRTPEEVERANGFVARGFSRLRRNEQLSAEELEKGSSLFYHSTQDVAAYTQYVSTSRSPYIAFGHASQFTLTLKDGKNIYLYKIHQDRKMVDVKSTLSRWGDEHFNFEEELAAIGGVPFDQIMGWIEVRLDNIRQIFNANKEIRDDAPLTLNPKYNERKYSKRVSSGSQPQLAGFPRESPAWEDEQFRMYKSKSASNLLRNFVWKWLCHKDSICLRERWPLEPRKSASLDDLRQTNTKNNCRRIAAQPDCGPSISSEQEHAKDEAQGVESGPEPELEKPDIASSPAAGRNPNKLSTSELEARPDKIRMPAQLNENPQHRLIRGLGLLQAAQFLTNAVNSGATHLKSGAWDHIKSDAEHNHIKEALATTGLVLKQVALDTVPGLTDLERHVDDYHSAVQSLKDKGLLDAMVGTAAAGAELVDNIMLTIFLNFMPGVPEIISNWNIEHKEYSNFNGTETAVQKAERLARIIGKGAACTLDDVLRNWVPGFREAQETIEEHTRYLVEDMKLYHENKQSLWKVIFDTVTTPVELVTGTLHRFMRDYIPFESQVEDALGIEPPGGQTLKAQGKSFHRSLCEDPLVDWDRLPRALSKSIKFKCERLLDPTKPWLGFHKTMDLPVAKPKQDAEVNLGNLGLKRDSVTH